MAGKKQIYAFKVTTIVNALGKDLEDTVVVLSYDKFGRDVGFNHYCSRSEDLPHTTFDKMEYVGEVVNDIEGLGIVPVGIKLGKDK